MDDVLKDKKKGISAMSQYASKDMNGNKRFQVDRLIEDMNLADSGHEYKLVLLKLKEGRNPKGQKVTVSMCIILKRQPAIDNSRTRVHGLDSRFVDINEDPQDSRIPHDFSAPPPQAHRGSQLFDHDPAQRIFADRQGVPIPSPHPMGAGLGFTPQHDHFPPQPYGYTPPSDGSASPLDYFPPGPAYPIPPEDDRRAPEPYHDHKQHHNGPIPHHHEPEHHHDARDDFRHGGPPGEQAKKPRQKGGKPKTGDSRSKKTPAKRDKGEHPAYPDPFESDLSESWSDGSGFSKAGTNRTGDTEVSDHRKEKRHSGDHGHRSPRGGREGEHDDYDRGNRRDRPARRRDSQRSSRGSHDMENDFSRSTIRQHRRKSPLRSSNSSPSSGSRYHDDPKVYAPSNSRRARRDSEYLRNERPAFHSRNDSYEEVRPPRRPGMYSGKRMSGYNPHVEIYDERDEFTETVRAQVKQELDKKEREDLKRENQRLHEELYRPEPIMNERERYPRLQSELPRSKRFSADLQSNRYPY